MSIPFPPQIPHSMGAALVRHIRCVGLWVQQPQLPIFTTQGAPAHPLAAFLPPFLEEEVSMQHALYGCLCQAPLSLLPKLALAWPPLPCSFPVGMASCYYTLSPPSLMPAIIADPSLCSTCHLNPIVRLHCSERRRLNRQGPFCTARRGLL